MGDDIDPLDLHTVREAFNTLETFLYQKERPPKEQYKMQVRGRRAGHIGYDMMLHFLTGRCVPNLLGSQVGRPSLHLNDSRLPDGTAVRYITGQREVNGKIVCEAKWHGKVPSQASGSVYKVSAAGSSRPHGVNAANIMVRRPADGSFVPGDLVMARTDPDADPVEAYIQGKGVVPCTYSVLI